MFDKYHYIQLGDTFIVYETNTVDDGVKMSLHKNEKLLDSKIGLTGTFTLEGKDVKLEIINKTLKSTQVLYVNGEKKELQKIKKKALRKILTEHNIFNSVNPTKEQLKEMQFDPKSLTIPLILILVGFIGQYFVHGLGKSYWLLPAIPEAIAGWMLYDIIIVRASWLQGLRRGRLGFMAAVVVLLGLLGEFLFPML